MTDRRLVHRPLEEVVAESVAGGVDWVQIREKDLSGRALLELIERVRNALPASDAAQLIVNRRLDVAFATGCGVHLGFDALEAGSVREVSVREMMGDGGSHGPNAHALVGVSAHSASEVVAAKQAGASYVQLAPIFAPLSKAAARPALGLGPLREAARCGIPVLAQGGVDASNAASVLAARARGVAVTGAILLAEDVQEAAAALRRTLDAAAAA